MEPSPEKLQENAKKLGAKLLMKGRTVALAESCTGGLVAKILTDIPGSSDWFDSAIVSYSNASKSKLLNVPEMLISDFGAVSENAVLAMLKGLFEQTDASVGLSICGVAGPDGGSDEKPVGTVWIAWGLRDAIGQTQSFHFEGNREEVRLQAAQEAVSVLLELLS